jgi:hypothetical protein
MHILGCCSKHLSVAVGYDWLLPQSTELSIQIYIQSNCWCKLNFKQSNPVALWMSCRKCDKIVKILDAFDSSNCIPWLLFFIKNTSRVLIGWELLVEIIIRSVLLKFEGMTSPNLRQINNQINNLKQPKNKFWRKCMRNCVIIIMTQCYYTGKMQYPYATQRDVNNSVSKDLLDTSLKLKELSKSILILLHSGISDSKRLTRVSSHSWAARN